MMSDFCCHWKLTLFCQWEKKIGWKSEPCHWCVPNACFFQHLFMASHIQHLWHYLSKDRHLGNLLKYRPVPMVMVKKLLWTFQNAGRWPCVTVGSCQYQPKFSSHCIPLLNIMWNKNNNSIACSDLVPYISLTDAVIDLASIFIVLKSNQLFWPAATK